MVQYMPGTKIAQFSTGTGKLLLLYPVPDWPQGSAFNSSAKEAKPILRQSIIGTGNRYSGVAQW